MTFRHLILTRFNIQYDKQSCDGIQPQWLADRCRLFETYCLPSLQQQTCTDFTWVILADRRTPEPYQSRINSYETLLPNIKIHWTPFYDDYNILFQQIGKEYAQGFDLLLTSRIDNDDAFAPDYVQTIQQTVRNRHLGVVSFPVGRQTFLDNGKSYQIRYTENHFLSRIEASGFFTVMGFDHRDARKYNLLTIKTDHPMWEEIVHTGNIANQYVPSFHHKITGMSDFLDLSRRYWLVTKKRARKLYDIIFRRQQA
ncbi:MAG: hypothetical protein IJ650_05075 [Paludibacteraceae bacterium]|nr:hypothetical protein [Paludibacteraceae bacterium]